MLSIVSVGQIRSVTECLGAAGLTIKLRKCCFGRQHLLYLGHKISAGLLAIPEHRVTALANFVKPITAGSYPALLIVPVHSLLLPP